MRLLLAVVLLSASSAARAALAPTAPNEIDLSGRHLKSLPKDARLGDEVERLNLEDNALSSLPKAIPGLKRLRSLNLSKNRLKKLPPEIGALTSLEYLSLAGNPLTALPESIGKLSSLSILDLRGTPFTRVPDEALPLMRNGAAVLVSSSVAAGYAAAPFAALETRHILRETKLAYSVTLGLPRLPIPKEGRRTDFYFPPGNEIALFDPSLAYGAINGPYPCTVEERNPSVPEVASLPEKDLRAFLKKACPSVLYAHGEEGRVKLPVKDLRLYPLKCCGSACLRVAAASAPNAAKPLFFSTASGAKGKAAFVRLGRSTEVADWVKAVPLPVPAGFTGVRKSYYRYAAKDGEAVLAFVEADGILAEASEDPATASWGSWQGVYWLAPGAAKLLTPPHPADQRAYGASLEPVALYDATGDGVPDLILGRPVSLILERYADGFRSWGFPAPIANACPEEPAAPVKAARTDGRDK